MNGVITKYYLEGNNIIYEMTGNNIIYYLHDKTWFIGIKYNSVIYYFIKIYKVI